MDERALLEAIGKMMDERDKKLEAMIDAKLEPIKADLDILKEDVGILKEDSAITRSAVNTLLEWAEEAQIEVKIPLYKKAQ